MPRTSRYDKLTNKLNEEFSRSRTLSPAIPDGGGRKVLFHLDNHESTYAIPARFEKFGPFNAISVRNFANVPIRLYLNPERTAYIDVEADNGATQSVLQRLPNRYVRFLSVENLAESSDGSGDIAEGDVQIIVGNQIDGVELQLLEMSGLLNV